MYWYENIFFFKVYCTTEKNNNANNKNKHSVTLLLLKTLKYRNYFYHNCVFLCLFHNYFFVLFLANSKVKSYEFSFVIYYLNIKNNNLIYCMTMKVINLENEIRLLG